ncbi:MAG: hypothetical protein ACOY3Y_12920 [Acidobacteriota bacterium]
MALSVVLAVVVVAAQAATAADYPTQDSLIDAWEKAQRADPTCRLLEKVSDNRYRYATTRFPYEGELLLLNTVLDDGMEELEDDGWIIGTVEVELVGLPADFPARYARSYGSWMQSHTLYFDRGLGRWLTSGEFRGRLAARVRRQTGALGFLGNALWLVIPIALVAFLWYAGRKASRQVNTAQALQEKAMADQQAGLRLAQRAVDLNEEANRLLVEIRDLLRQRSGSGGGGT